MSQYIPAKGNYIQSGVDGYSIIAAKTVEDVVQWLNTLSTYHSIEPGIAFNRATGQKNVVLENYAQKIKVEFNAALLGDLRKAAVPAKWAGLVDRAEGALKAANAYLETGRTQASAMVPALRLESAA